MAFGRAVHRGMDGEFEQFEEVDDDILASIPLDFPFETAEDCDVKTVPVTDTKETSTPSESTTGI